RDARALQAAVRSDDAAVRRDGGAVARPRRHADERDLPLSPRLQRQRDGHRRSAGLRRLRRAGAAQRRSPHFVRAAHRQGPVSLCRDVGRARGLDRPPVRRHHGPRGRAVVRQPEIVPQRLGARRMKVTHAMSTHKPAHFQWRMDGDVAVIRLNRPERKNPLTFESYAELRDTFRALRDTDDVAAVVFLPNGGNFCSGGDVHDIIGPLVAMDMKRLLAFTRMTGDLVKAMLGCGKPIIAAIDGVAVGSGAIIAMASDIRLATPEAKTAFLFTRVGLAGCDMGACAILPRIIGQGRASELLYTGRTMSADEGERWGFYNRIVDAAALDAEAIALARRLADGPNFGHMMTKTMLNQEWSMSIEQAIEAEAQAQAICMQTQDFKRAYDAFVAREKPAFKGD